MDALFDRCPPTTFELFVENPILFVAKRAYYSGLRRLNELTPATSPIRVVAISDTHGFHEELPPLPDGDILIHAGDLTQSGTPEQLRSALRWFENHPHPLKVFIAGNHDKGLSGTGADREAFLNDFPSLIYLDESFRTLTVGQRSVHVYGSPMTPRHGSWPFQYPRHNPDVAHWSKIPYQTDILVTHGPPAHHADNGSGCTALLSELWRVRPRLHVFGHIHAARGTEHAAWSDAQAAYERIASGGWSWWDLFVVVWGMWQKNTTRSIFVNAASLGGHKDTTLRGAIVVDI